jgi:hypothetical protein
MVKDRPLWCGAVIKLSRYVAAPVAMALITVFGSTLPAHAAPTLDDLYEAYPEYEWSEIFSPGQIPDDLDCADFADEEGNLVEVEVHEPDPYGLDADNDGVGCEEPGTPAPGPGEIPLPDDDHEPTPVKVPLSIPAGV